MLIVSTRGILKYVRSKTIFYTGLDRPLNPKTDEMNFTLFEWVEPRVKITFVDQSSTKNVRLVAAVRQVTTEITLSILDSLGSPSKG